MYLFAFACPAEPFGQNRTSTASKTTFDANYLCSYDKAMRMGEDLPRRIAANSSVSRRLKSHRDFHWKVEEIRSIHSVSGIERELCVNLSTAAWDQGIYPCIVFPSLEGGNGRHDCTRTLNPRFCKGCTKSLTLEWVDQHCSPDQRVAMLRYIQGCVLPCLDSSYT